MHTPESSATIRSPGMTSLPHRVTGPFISTHSMRYLPVIWVVPQEKTG